MAGLGSVRQEVETVRRRKRNEGKQKAVSSAQSQSRPNGSSRHIYVRWTQSTPSHRSVPRKVIAPDCPTRVERAGLGEDGQPRPRRAANEDRTETGEDLTPGHDGTPTCDIAN